MPCKYKDSNINCIDCEKDPLNCDLFVKYQADAEKQVDGSLFYEPDDDLFTIGYDPANEKDEGCAMVTRIKDGKIIEIIEVGKSAEELSENYKPNKIIKRW